LLKRFGVQVLRPDLPTSPLVDGKFMLPPMTPRDNTAMIGNKFYANYLGFDFALFYNNVKDSTWPDCTTIDEFEQLPANIREECIQVHGLTSFSNNVDECYQTIHQAVKNQGNQIVQNFHPHVNGAMVSRIGKDLYFGTHKQKENLLIKQSMLDKEFSNYRNHVINTCGHSDGTYCPICPGLIISLQDVPTYQETFPDWEVVYLPNQSWNAVKPFLKLKEKNQGRWWIPGFEHDQDVIDVVESWLSHWTGYVEETVFDVNMLIIDPKNVIVFNYNKQVFDALARYGITPHIVPFRHRYFWDGGIHCVTSDLHREGTMQDYFPERTDV
jgi:glycine amidinotransferase